MKNSLSKETKENFIHWVNNWDASIQTLDDHDNLNDMKARLIRGSDRLNLLLSDSDSKALAKFPKDDKKAVENMFENQNKEWYKDLKNIAADMQTIAFQIEKLYELKFRRTHENFKLRAENAKLRQ